MKKVLKKLLVSSMILAMGLEQVGLPVYAEVPSENAVVADVPAAASESNGLPAIGELPEDPAPAEVPDMEVPDTNALPKDTTEAEKSEVTEESKAFEKTEATEPEKELTEDPVEDTVTDLPMNADASGTCGADLSWMLDESGTLTITGTGSMSNYSIYSQRAPWYDSRASIKKLVIGEGVTSIGACAFRDCTDLEAVSLPVGLNAINGYAFSGCSALRSIILPDTVKTLVSRAFENCSGLEEAVIPAYCTGTDAFDNSSSQLTIVAPKGSDGWQTAVNKNIAFRDLGDGKGTVTCGNLLPETIQSGNLGDSTWTLSQTTGILRVNGSGVLGDGNYSDGWFSNNNNSWISKALITGSFTEIKDGCFQDYYRMTEVQLPDTITIINTGAFAGCSLLEKINLPENLVDIRNNAFSNCRKLTSVVVPASVKSLGFYAFINCGALETVVLPEGLTTIYDQAFYGCTALKNVNIPSTVTMIGYGAFYGCSALESITLPAGVTALYGGVFYGCKQLKLTVSGKLTEIGDNALYDCQALTELPLEEGLTKIGNYAFSKSGIQRISLPDSVISVGANAFDACAALESVKLSKGLKVISERCFYNCNALKEINLPENLTEIGREAFYQCVGLREVVLPESVKKIDEAFSMCTGLERVELNLGTEGNSLTGRYAFQKAGTDTLQVILHGSDVAVPEQLLFMSNVQTLQLDEEITGIGYQSVGQCEKLTSARLPGVRKIDEYGFANCTALQSVEMKKVETMGKYAFSNTALTSLKDADVPALREIGSNAFSYCKFLQEVLLSGLTELPSYTFYGCEALATAELPNVTVLGTGAFAASGITAFSNAKVTDAGNAVFQNCSQLVSVSLPNLNEIPQQMFESCSSLTDYRIPSDCTSIGSNAFYRCTKLTELNLPEGLQQIADSAFNQMQLTEITIPASVTSLGQTICSGVTTLRKITLLAENLNLPVSGNGAFQNTNNTEPLEIIVSGKTLPRYCFYGLKIASVDLGNKLEQIDTYAFGSCSGLTKITMPDSVTRLANSAFYYCRDLAEVKLSGKLNNMGKNCFYSTSYYSSVPVTNGLKMDQGWIFEYSGSDTELIIPEGVVGLAAEAFYYKTTITSVVMPASLRSIGNSAFYYCSALENIEIRGTLEYLGDSAFQGTKWSNTTEMQIIHSTNGDYFLGYKGSESVLTLPESVKYVYLSTGSISSSVKKIVFTGEIEAASSSAFGVAANNAAIEFATPMSWLEVAEKYGSDTIRTSQLARKASESWIHSLGDLIGTSDQILSLNGDSLDSLSARRLARMIMEENGITTMKEAYDWICSHCGYTTSTGYPYSDAAGPLVYGTASCQGYALAMKAFLDELGIMNYIAIGKVTGIYGTVSHAWNMVGSAGMVVDATDTRKGDYSTYMKSLSQLPQYTVDGYENANASRRQAAFDTFKGRTLSSSPLSFVENADGTVTVSSCEGGAENVVIPSTWNGKAVTAIGENAFTNCQWLISVTIPNGIRSIGAYAFKNCIALKEITLPVSVKEIGIGAFLSCISLKKADLSNTRIKTIPTYAFLGDLDLYEIYLPASVTSISTSCMSVKYINNTNGVFTCSIYGTAGSQAETFATGKGLPFVDIGGGDNPEQKPFEVEAAQVVLRENFDFRLYVKASEDLLNDDSSFVEFTVGNETQRVKGVSAGNGKLLYSCKVAAAQLADVITADLCCKGAYYNAGEYSVQSYLETLIRNEDNNAEYTAVHDLAVNLLNYGAYAQRYFGYNTGHLANTSLSYSEKALAADDAVRSSIDRIVHGTFANEDLEYQGVSLLCENATGLRLYFENRNGLSLSRIREKYSISVSGVDSSDVETGIQGDSFYITLRNIPIGGLDEEYCFRIGTIEVWCSPMAYVKLAMDSNNTDLKNLCKALWKLS